MLSPAHPTVAIDTNFRIIHRGSQLPATATLQQYGVRQLSALQLLPRLAGGGSEQPAAAAAAPLAGRQQLPLRADAGVSHTPEHVSELESSPCHLQSFARLHWHASGVFRLGWRRMPQMF